MISINHLINNFIRLVAVFILAFSLSSYAHDQQQTQPMDSHNLLLDWSDIPIGKCLMKGTPRQNCQDTARNAYLKCKKAAGKDLDARKVCIAEFKIEKEFCLERF